MTSPTRTPLLDRLAAREQPTPEPRRVSAWVRRAAEGKLAAKELAR